MSERTICSVCNEPQFETPSGWTCENGHGGAPGETPVGYLLKDSNCELCDKPMPKGEERFRYHGFSGPCPGETQPSTNVLSPAKPPQVPECRFCKNGESIAAWHEHGDELNRCRNPLQPIQGMQVVSPVGPMPLMSPHWQASKFYSSEVGEIDLDQIIARAKRASFADNFCPACGQHRDDVRKLLALIGKSV